MIILIMLGAELYKSWLDNMYTFLIMLNIFPIFSMKQVIAHLLTFAYQDYNWLRYFLLSPKISLIVATTDQGV